MALLIQYIYIYIYIYIYSICSCIQYPDDAMLYVCNTNT